jgi:hypothetical protein
VRACRDPGPLPPHRRPNRTFCTGFDQCYILLYWYCSRPPRYPPAAPRGRPCVACRECSGVALTYRLRVPIPATVMTELLGVYSAPVYHPPVAVVDPCASPWVLKLGPLEHARRLDGLAQLHGGRDAGRFPNRLVMMAPKSKVSARVIHHPLIPRG